MFLPKYISRNIVNKNLVCDNLQYIIEKTAKLCYLNMIVFF